MKLKQTDIYSQFQEAKNKMNANLIARYLNSGNQYDADKGKSLFITTIGTNKLLDSFRGDAAR